MSEALLIKPDRNLLKTLGDYGANTQIGCIQCATCSTTCSLSPAERPFPRKEMLWTRWGLSDRLLADPDIWLCHQCGDCSDRCPRSASPGDMLAAIRRYAFEKFAFPGFMGKLMSKPAGLPWLLLLPIIIIGALAMLHTGGDFSFMSRSEVVFADFIPDPFVEVLFVFGNVLVFTFAAVGLKRFYNGLKPANPDTPKKGFIASLIGAGLEMLSHKRFADCDVAHYRNFAHLLVFYGFLGALVTTAVAMVAIFLFDYHPPFPMTHPIKLLGNLSGAALVVGSVIIIVRRWGDEEIAGKTVYGQQLFIWMLLVVTLTGLGSQFLRIAELPVLAYPTYFLHLVTVFFLLWYAPYSQFAHMFYRALAMVFAHSIGRKPMPKVSGALLAPLSQAAVR